MKIAFISDALQNLGVRSILSVLRANGHEVKVFIDPQLFDDLYLCLDPWRKIFDIRKQIVAELKDYNPDLVGISATTFTYQWACNIAKMVKEEMDVLIIFGGTHPTVAPERVIGNDFVDMICVGEGEYPVLELVNSMRENSAPDTSIKNLWFKKNGQVIKNEIRPLIADLDSLPLPDRDLYDLTVFYFARSYAMLTSKGCPFFCAYCTNSYFHKLYSGKGKYLRQRSVRAVIDELIKAKAEHNIKSVTFMDDCFGYDSNWLKDFSVEFKNKVSLEFFCLMHPEHITKESIKYLKNAGCRAINLGIQSWDEKVREHLFSRKVSNEVMINAIELILNEKIEVTVDNLFGFPGYDMEEYIKSLLIYTRIKPTRNNFYQLKYYPNTELFNEAKIKGWISQSKCEDSLDGKNLDNLRFESNGAKKGREGKDFLRMQTLFVVMDLVPKKITSYIIQKKLYRYFPTWISPVLFTIFRDLVRSDFETSIIHTSLIRKYIYFMRKKIFSLLVDRKFFRRNKTIDPKRKLCQ